MTRLFPSAWAASIMLASVAHAADQTWYESPSVSIMTGFIYEPLSPYTIHQWKETLGSRFDADRWAKDFKEAEAGHLVFYDKWIDGLVFHDTKTTDFKTNRDFVGELAAACRRHDLPLVFYFNAISDGNPEFDQWSLPDRQGRPIVFSPRWPTRYQTLHSPFRRKAVEQVRELLSNYGPVHGIWHDIFTERLQTSSKWTAQGYEKMFGEKFENASPARLAEFNVRTLAGYLDEIEVIRRRQHQDDCIYTANGSGSSFLPAGLWTRQVGRRLHYLFNEGHSFARNDQLARMARVLPKPLEINFLINSSWFTPLEDAPPPPKWTRKQVIAATAIVVCQGGSVHFALTPGHSGVFGEDLQHAKAAGAWFRRVRPVLKDARPYADVAIVLGTPAADGPGLPTDAWGQAVALGDALGREGVFVRFLYDTQHGGSWPESLGRFRAIVVPELAVLDGPHLQRLREYVKQGGRLIGFGQATMLNAKGERSGDYALGDVFGARYKGQLALSAPRCKTLVKVDSEYSTEFAAKHLIDGRPTAWASGGTPMPHWAEITLPEPAEVAAVRLVSRQGPYLVADFDVHARVDNVQGDNVQGNGNWKLVKSVRSAAGSEGRSAAGSEGRCAATRAILARLDAPVRTDAIRVTILRELYEGQDRQYADLEAVAVLDKTGRDCSTCPAEAIPLIVTAEDSSTRRVVGTGPIFFPTTAVDVQPTTAEVIARLDVEDGPPAVLRNRYADGEAILITSPQRSLNGQEAQRPSLPAALFAAVRRLAVGEPTLSCSDRAATRYRFILTRLHDQHVLHVIDPVAQGGGFQPGEVEISLRAERLGGLSEARLVGAAGSEGRCAADPLPTRQSHGLITFVVRPDPVASILLY